MTGFDDSPLVGRPLGMFRSGSVLDSSTNLNKCLHADTDRASMDEMMMSRRTESLRAFARQLLVAFNLADVYAAKQLDVRSRTHGRRRGMSASSLSIGMFRVESEEKEEPRNLKNIHSSCIEGSIDTLVRLIGVATFEDEKSKVQIALEGDPSELSPSITFSDVISALDNIAETFLETVRTRNSGSGTKQSVRIYSPDWKTRNMIWCLVRAVGTINPARENATEVLTHFALLKEAIFTALFNGDYLVQQAKNTSFKHGLTSRIPTPSRPEASLGWVAVGLFVSVPSTGAAYMHTLGSNRMFFAVLPAVFAAVSCFLIVSQAGYSSWYARCLLDSVASSIQEHALQRLSDEDLTGIGRKRRNDVEENPAKTPSIIETKPVAEMPPRSCNYASGLRSGHKCLDSDTSEGESEFGASPKPGSPPRFSSLFVEEEYDACTATLLPLYQASLLLEKLDCSYYFDERLLIGLSDSQVHEAIQTCLTSDQALGQVLTTFSFIAISMSSAGARLNLAGTETGTDSHARFVFSVFSLLAASAFLCAVLATLLSQLVKRQLALTQTKEDHTAHEFAARFGFYIRLGGGLTSFAAMFLATAIFHFLLSIYQVPVSVAVALAACWIVGGTLAVESFMSKFGLWTLGEIFDDVGEVIDSPAVLLSSSPVTGSVQLAAAALTGMLSRSRTRFRFAPQLRSLKQHVQHAK